MVEAASSGCIDYTKANSRDHKFILKEDWILKLRVIKEVFVMLEVYLLEKQD